MSAMHLAHALLDDDHPDDAHPDHPHRGGADHGGADPGDAGDGAAGWRAAPAPSPVDLLADAFAEAQAVPARLADRAAALLADRERIRAGAARLRRAVESLPAAGGFAEGPFNVAVGADRRVTWTTLPARVVRDAARAAGVPTGDAVLGIIAGALGHLLAERGDGTDRLRVLVPVADAGPERRGEFGNEGSCVLVDLPVGPLDPLVRLRRVAAETSRVRDAGQRLVASTLRGVWEALPAGVDPLVSAAGAAQRDHCHLVVSYMRGTRRRLSFDGARHLATVPIPPLAPRLALTVAAARLGDAVAFGFTGDWAAVPDLDRLPEGVHATATAVLAAAAVPALAPGQVAAEGR